MSWVIAADHAGVRLKEFLVDHLKSQGLEVVDLGLANEDGDSYVDHANKVVDQIKNGNAEYGILLCGTGIGMSMVANRHKGIRAALVHNPQTSVAAKEHNNANILCMGGRTLTPDMAVATLQGFLMSHFEGGRHEKRIAAIDA